MTRANRWSVIVLAGAIALSVASAGARADTTTDQQNKKNNYRNLGIGAGAVGLYGLTHGNPLVAIIGAAGAALAGKKYEDTRRDQAGRSESAPLYDRAQSRTTSGTAVPIQEQGIGVSVDGRNVDFSGAQPIEEDGTVLVPLRDVFYALGAVVDYDAATATVTAIKDGRTVVVPIGSTIATINGQRQQLSEPAQVINGSTMVPLRFVAEAFGDDVNWSPSTRTVNILSSQGPAPLSSAPPAMMSALPAAVSSVSGVVNRVNTDTSPHEIIVLTNGESRVIPISDRVVVLRGRQGAESTPVNVSDLEPGDHVLVRINQDGNAVSIASAFGMLHGSVNTVGTLANGDKVVVLNSGQTVELSPNARVSRNGALIAPSDLNQGDQVAISTDPTDDIGYRVNVERPIEAHRRP